MKKILLSLFLFANLFNYAQSQNSWKHITPQDFTVKSNDTAHAIIIYEKTRYYFDEWNEELRLFQTVERKIKILDSKGLNFGNVEIKYNNKNHFEDLVEIKGFVFSNKNGKISKSRLKQKNIITQREPQGYVTKKTDFQNLKAGDIVTYKYTIASLNMVTPPKWHFQHKIPTLYSKAEVVLPEFFQYKIAIKGITYNLGKKQDESNMVLDYIFHYDDPIPGIGGYNNSFRGTAHFNFQATTYSFSMSNIPSVKQYDYLDCMCNYQSSLKLDLYRVTENTNLITPLEHFAWTLLTQRLYLVTVNNNPVQSLMTSQYLNTPSSFILYSAGDWKTSDKWFLKDDKFYPVLLKAWNYKPHLDSALGKTAFDDRMQNVIKIYNYVKTHFHWNQHYSMYPSQHLDKTAIIKTGNSTDINFMLISLLQKRGFKAYPVLIKIVSTGHIDEQLASYRQFNHTIAAVEVEGKTLFLDAINPNIPWYLLPKEDLNGRGRIIKPETCDFIDIKPNKTSYRQEIANIKLNPKFSDYKITRKLFGYFAVDYADSTVLQTQKYYKSLGKITDLEFKNIDSADILYNTIQFKLNNSVTDTLYPFDAFIFNNTSLLNTDRKLPVYFGFSNNIRYLINIEIPDGYTFSDLPNDFTIKYDGIIAQSQVVQNSNKLTIILLIKISKPLFSSQEYPNLRKVFLQIEDLRNHPLIIKKKE